MGKLEQSARLISRTEATREKIRGPPVPKEHADLDRIIAAWLAKMGAVSFSDVYDEGQKMSLEEAVVFALKEG